MFTVVFIGSAILNCGLLLLQSKLFPKKEKIKDNVAIFLMFAGIVIAAVGPFISLDVSRRNIPDEYVLIDQHKTLCYDGETFVKESDNLLAKSMWIPGGAIEFETCKLPSHYLFCKDCLRPQYENYCERCGKLLVNLCPNCGKKCDESYCGTCGVKATMGG